MEPLKSVYKLVRANLIGRDEHAYKNHTNRSFKNISERDPRLPRFLIEKLEEEVREVSEEMKVRDRESLSTPYALIEELADVVDVVEAVLDYYGIDIELFDMVREQKLARKGGFTPFTIYSADLIHPAT